MLRKTAFVAIMFAMVTWGLVGTASAQNDSPYKETYFTFSQPVTLPNMELPAGKYLFRVVSDKAPIVQIYSGDRTKLHGTVMTAQAARSDQPTKPEIRLIESSANSPIAVGTWWYPGQRQGWEFIYPRAQATKLAKTAREPILTTARDTNNVDEMKSADLVRLEPSGAQSAYTASSTPAPRPLSGTAQVGEVAAADQNANRVAAAMSPQSARGQTGRTTLPQTASSTPLIALAGVFALAIAFGLRFWRRSAA